MADTYVSPIDTVQLTILLGNGGSPETFSAPATVNAKRGVNLTSNAATTEVPDVTNPLSPSKTMRTVVSLDSNIDGEGIMDHADLATWTTWWQSGLQKNIEVFAGPNTGDVTIAAPYILTSLQVTGAKKGEKVTVTVKMEQADVVTLGTHA
jgi:hypothetical protein